MNQNYDVVIMGTGIIGSSIAAHLALENASCKIALINSNSLGTPASVAAAGLLTPYQLNELENPLLKDLCLKSFDYFPEFLEKINTNIDLGYKKTGSLYLIFSNFEIAQKENEIKSLKNAKGKISFLNKQEVLKHESNITNKILGAYYYHEEALINNQKLLKAITSYLQEKNVLLKTTEVAEIKTSKNKIDCLTLTDNETISSKKYILCNGVWANKCLKKLFNTNENLITPVKGEILQIGTKHELPIQKIIFCKEGYILPRLATNQYERDSILIGSTSDEIDLETNKFPFENTIHGISHLTNLLQSVLPGCKDSPILNMWSGLRPKTKDSLPILGKTPEIENLYLALGHYRNGVLIGPYTGKILKDLILENTPDYNIEPYKVDRFLKTLVSHNSLS